MKTQVKIFGVFLAMVFSFGMFSVSAQEGEESPFGVGADVVSSYVWRGAYISPTAVQPYVEYSNGGFTIGSWGSLDFIGSVFEADLYASYSFDFGLSLGVTDYYYPYFNYEGTDYFNVSDTAGAHALELNLGYEIGGFSLSGNYIVNEAPGAGSVGGDTYIELGYSFENVSVFAGAGNGWHTSEEAGEDDEFGLVNIGISSSKEIKLSESFSLPVGVSVIWNPHAEKFFIVGMISF